LSSRLPSAAWGSPCPGSAGPRGDQLGVDRRHVLLGRDPALDVDDVIVMEGPQDLADRMGLPDVGQELVAQAGSLAGALERRPGQCRRRSRWRAPLARSRRARPGRQAGHPARRPRRCWARWWQNG
jgi:hypothetical protein